MVNGEENSARSMLISGSGPTFSSRFEVEKSGARTGLA